MRDMEILREPWLNRSLGSLGFIASILQLCNMSFGIVRNAAEERVNTLIIWDWLNGERIDSVPAPYFDDIFGWLILLVAVFFLWSSLPASGVRPEPIESPMEEE